MNCYISPPFFYKNPKLCSLFIVVGLSGGITWTYGKTSLYEPGERSRSAASVILHMHTIVGKIPLSYKELFPFSYWGGNILFLGWKRFPVRRGNISLFPNPTFVIKGWVLDAHFPCQKRKVKMFIGKVSQYMILSQSQLNRNSTQKLGFTRK